MRAFLIFSFLFVSSTLNAQWADWTSDPTGVFIRGDTNDSGTVDLSDYSYLMSYLFQGGPAPIEIDSADVTDDGLVDISDGYYLTDFLYMGGDAPVEPYPGVGTDDTGDNLNVMSPPAEAPPRPQAPGMTSREGTENTTPPTPAADLPESAASDATNNVVAWPSIYPQFQHREDEDQADVIPKGDWNTRKIHSHNTVCDGSSNLTRSDKWTLTWFGDRYENANKKSVDSLSIYELRNTMGLPGGAKRKLPRVKITFVGAADFSGSLTCSGNSHYATIYETLKLTVGGDDPKVANDTPIKAVLTVVLKPKDGSATPVVTLKKELDFLTLLSAYASETYMGTRTAHNDTCSEPIDNYLTNADVDTANSTPNIDQYSELAKKPLFVYSVKLSGLFATRSWIASAGEQKDIYPDDDITCTVKCEVKYKYASVRNGTVVIDPKTDPF